MATSTSTTIGLAWDKEHSTLKASVLKDLLTIKESFANARVELLDGLAKPAWLDGLANLANLAIVAGCEPSVWLVYIVEHEPLLPPGAAEVIRRSLVPKAGGGARMSEGGNDYPDTSRPSDRQVVPPQRTLNLNNVPPKVTKNQPYTLPRNYYELPFI